MMTDDTGADPLTRDSLGGILSQEGDGEFRCDHCGNRCTEGPSGIEYGHKRRPRCPRRPAPEKVDPIDKRTGDSDG